jgi:RNA polymerase sigma factor (sigma-70 family)
VRLICPPPARFPAGPLSAGQTSPELISVPNQLIGDRSYNPPLLSYPERVYAIDVSEQMVTVIPTSTPYEEHREYVLAVLARRCGWLDPSDREALLHDAYAVLLEKQRDHKLDLPAMRPPQMRAYLTQTALNKAMDEGKRAGRRRSVSLDDEAVGVDPTDPRGPLDETVASRFDDARVREIVAELPARQQTVVKLRFYLDRSPQEIQQYLGVTERVYRRDLERAARHIAHRYELVRAGVFCETRRSLILAYVTGVAGPNRTREARRHLDSCPGCANWAAEEAALGWSRCA